MKCDSCKNQICDFDRMYAGLEYYCLYAHWLGLGEDEENENEALRDDCKDYEQKA